MATTEKDTSTAAQVLGGTKHHIPAGSYSVFSPPREGFVALARPDGTVVAVPPTDFGASRLPPPPAPAPALAGNRVKPLDEEMAAVGLTTLEAPPSAATVVEQAPSAFAGDPLPFPAPMSEPEAVPPAVRTPEPPAAPRPPMSPDFAPPAYAQDVPAGVPDLPAPPGAHGAPVRVRPPRSAPVPQPPEPHDFPEELVNSEPRFPTTEQAPTLPAPGDSSFAEEDSYQPPPPRPRHLRTPAQDVEDVEDQRPLHGHSANDAVPGRSRPTPAKARPPREEVLDDNDGLESPAPSAAKRKKPKSRLKIVLPAAAALLIAAAFAMHGRKPPVEPPAAAKQEADELFGDPQAFTPTPGQQAASAASPEPTPLEQLPDAVREGAEREAATQDKAAPKAAAPAKSEEPSLIALQSDEPQAKGAQPQPTSSANKGAAPAKEAQQKSPPAKEQPTKDQPQAKPAAEKPQAAPAAAPAAVQKPAAAEPQVRTIHYGELGIAALLDRGVVVTKRGAGQSIVSVGSALSDGSILKAVDVKANRITTDRGVIQLQ